MIDIHELNDSQQQRFANILRALTKVGCAVGRWVGRAVGLFDGFCVGVLV